MLAYGNPLIVSVVSHIHGTKWYFGLCHKTEGCLVMHSFSAWAPFLTFPSFYSFLWQTHTYPSSILAITPMGHSKCFPPNQHLHAAPLQQPGSPTRTVRSLLGSWETLPLCCFPSCWMRVKRAHTFPSTLVPFQCLWRAAFCHTGNTRA